MKRVLVVVVSILPLVLACSGATAPTANPAVSSEPTPGATGVAEVVPVDASPCDLLTADEVAAATGFTVQDVLDQPPISCAFDLGTEAGVDIFVTTEDGQGRLTGAASLFESYSAMVANGDAEFVANVGEQAVCCAFRTIAVHAGGGRYIAIGVNGSYAQLAEPREVLVSLAQAALGRL
jgi:hypothetical protein